MFSTAAMRRMRYMRIERLAREETPVTTDTALRLAKFFGTTPQFWMNMQAAYDLAIGAEAIEDEIAAIERSKTWRLPEAPYPGNIALKSHSACAMRRSFV